MNLFTLFSMQRICKIEPWLHPWLANQKPSAFKYFKAVDFNKWKNDPGLALVSYAMVQRQFGWEPIAATMQKISSTLNNDHASNQDKMDAWVRVLSQACASNLVPYYRAWGMPLSPSVVNDAELQRLPVWGADPLALMA